jgi:hypothetical protein
VILRALFMALSIKEQWPGKLGPQAIVVATAAGDNWWS